MEEQKLVEDWTALGMNLVTGWEAETEADRAARRLLMRRKITAQAIKDIEN